MPRAGLKPRFECQISGTVQIEAVLKCFLVSPSPQTNIHFPVLDNPGLYKTLSLLPLFKLWAPVASALNGPVVGVALACFLLRQSLWSFGVRPLQAAGRQVTGKKLPLGELAIVALVPGESDHQSHTLSLGKAKGKQLPLKK